MRHITKGNADYFLDERNKSKPSSAEEATTAWSRFDYKQNTVRVCLIEQFSLCCYSEVSLNERFPILGEQGMVVSSYYGYHLEHVEPKSSAPQKTFEHSNLMVSAISSEGLKSLDKKDVFGGHAKLKMFSNTSFINPLMLNSQDYFHYEISGKVVPKASINNRREKAKARLTIYMLNLNSPVLVQWRRIWITEMSNLIDEHDLEAIGQMADLELSPIGNALRPFHTAQKQLFGKIGEQVCKRYDL